MQVFGGAITCQLRNVSGDTPKRSLSARIWRTLSYRLPESTSEITP